MTRPMTTPPPPDLQGLSIDVSSTPSPKRSLDSVDSSNKEVPVSASSSTSSSKSSRIRPMSRSNSMRSKGFNLNLAVSPLAATPSSQAPSSINSRKLVPTISLHQVEESPVPTKAPPSPSIQSSTDLKYDVPLPSVGQLLHMDIDEQLRLLALKEMCVVEIKDAVSNLNKKLDKHEKELHRLREVIQKSLYKELTHSASNAAIQKDHQDKKTNGRPRQDSNPRDEAIASTRRRRTLSSSSHPNISSILNSPGANGGSGGEVESDTKANSKIWSNLSKPLNLLQQFDTMLQNEFEKSLTGGPPIQNYHNSSINQNTYQPRRSEDSISSFGSAAPSPLKSKSRIAENRADLDQYLAAEYSGPGVKANAEEMLQTVSTSIWTFVNDVKTNVLSSLREEEIDYKQNPNHMGNTASPPTIYNLDTGSTVSIDKTNNESGNDTSIISLNGRLDDDGEDETTLK
ncbi:topoisomerase I damage affected protein 11 [Scheffersomyces coipomensis]|uniref:topoisomerase I damage affected protein 11 n=1 Tax=Scheffersomyces coipomensis TaxID=1788519 RepID=UPI00315D394D